MKETNEVIFEDELGTSLAYWVPGGGNGGYFNLVWVDGGGGYTAVMMRPFDWEKVKAKVDKLIAEGLNETTD